MIYVYAETILANVPRLPNRQSSRFPAQPSSIMARPLPTTSLLTPVTPERPKAAQAATVLLAAAACRTAGCHSLS